MRIKAAVLDAVSGVVPGRGRRLERERIGEGEIHEQQPVGFRLARSGEHQNP